MNWLIEYHRLIENGSVIVSKRLRMVYDKLADDVTNPKGGYFFSEKHANKPIEFIEKFCKHSKGEWAGQPVKLELFQKAFIGALFGFVDADGNRKYRESMFYVARKNGKSTLLSGLALYCLVADGEAGAEVYTAATKKEQAKIIFDECVNMTKQSPNLAKNLKKRKTDLYFELTFSKLQPLGKNADTLDGLNGSAIIIDELHSIKDRNLYEVLKQSQSARRNPLLIMITTAGTLRASIFDDMYSYACGVAEGTIEDKGFLPILYELDEKAEWQNPEMWQKANPALGSIKKIEDLQAKVKRAAQSPQDLTGVLVKDFNIIENQSMAWLTFEDINNTETFNIDDFKGYYAIGGADLSITTDLTCATILMINADEKVFVKQMYWLPEDNFSKRVQEEKIPYDKWRERNLLRLSQGNAIKFQDITAWFLEFAHKYEISPAWIYYDPYSARYWVQEMESYGFKMVKLFQTAKNLSLPMQMLGADLKAKKINYDDNPILKWCLGNTGVHEDLNGNIMPIKASGKKNRIDGAASLLDAYAGLYQHKQELLNVVRR